MNRVQRCKQLKSKFPKLTQSTLCPSHYFVIFFPITHSVLPLEITKNDGDPKMEICSSLIVSPRLQFCSGVHAVDLRQFFCRHSYTSRWFSYDTATSQADLTVFFHDVPVCHVVTHSYGSLSSSSSSSSFIYLLAQIKIICAQVNSDVLRLYNWVPFNFYKQKELTELIRSQIWKNFPQSQEVIALLCLITRSETFTGVRKYVTLCDRIVQAVRRSETVGMLSRSGVSLW